MPIHARCPHCQTLFQLNDSLDGKKVRCKNCKETFQVATGNRPLSSASSPFLDEKEQERESLARRRRDDRYEDDFAPPPPAPPIPRKWLILGGAIGLGGVLFVVLLIAGVSSMQSVEKKSASVTPLPTSPNLDLTPATPVQPSLPPPPPTTPKYGPDQTVQLDVSEAADPATRKLLEQKLGELTDAQPAVLDAKPAGQALQVSLAPVRDPNALAKKLESLVTVLSVQGRTLRVSARALRLAANPPAAGSFRPQVTQAAEAPAAEEERPAPVPPPAVWKLKPDPAAETVKLNPKTKTIPFVGAQRVLYPTTPSIYVAAGGGGVGVGAVVQLYNLQALKQGKRLTIPTGLDAPYALSPDGTLVAGKAGPAAGAQNNILDVWSFTTGKRAQSITLPDGTRSQIELLDFAQPGQLLVMKSSLGRRNVQMFDIEKGDLLREWIGPSTYQPNSAAMSPGRKYLAVGEKEKLWVYDLATGQVAGSVDLSGPSKQFFKYECFGLAFSPDGVELAGVFETPFKSRLISWDVARGEVLADHTFDKRLHWNYKGPPLEWLPDRSAWLVYGKHLIEHQTGKLVYEVPNMGPGTDRQLRVIGSDQLLDAVHGFQGAQLGVFPLPKADLEKVIDATRKAWAALSLPAAAPGDLAAARLIPAANNVKWSVTADAVPVPADRFAGRPIPLQQRESDVQRVLFARPEAAIAGVLNAVTPNQLFAKKVLRLERYDLTRGQPLGGLNLCVDPQYRFGEGVASDLSDDGTALALKGRQDPRRVDVWSVAEGKHLAAWLPYANEAGAASPGAAKPDQVTWLALLGAKRLFTLNSNGKLVLWGLPDARPVYALENVVNGSAVLSAGQRYLAVAQDGAYRIYETTSGAPVGVLDWPAAVAGTPGAVTASAAFSPDGSLLAALANGTLTCWDLKTGKLASTFAVGQGIAGITFGSGRYLIGRAAQWQPFSYLIDLDQQVVLCSYKLPGNNPAVGSPDGRLWYLQNTPNQSFLTAQAVPDKAALDVTAMLKDPSTPALLKPGAAVAVRVNVTGNDGVRLQIAEALHKRLQAAGLTPADGAPVTLTFSASLSPTGKNVQYTKLGGHGDRALSVPVQKLTVSATLGDAQNAWWKQESTAETSQTFFEHFRPGEDLAGRFENRLWQHGVTFAAQLQVPGRVLLVNNQPLVLPVPLTLGADAAP